MSKLSRLLKELCPEGVEYKTLGEIASIRRGGNFQKKHYVSNGIPCIHYGQIYTKYNLFVNETDSYIDPEVAKKQKFAESGDIIMAVTSENVEDVCKCIAWLGNDKVAVSGHTAIIHHNQNPKYLVYYLSSQMFQDQKRKMAHGTKVIEVSPAKLNEVKVAVPPLEVQREIVHILDSFTLLTAELTEKLTAELTARRKQYEFYRDKLLSHNEIYPIKPISELGKWYGGKTPSMSEKSFWEQGTIPWISSKDIKISTLADTQDHITEKAVKESSMKVYPANSIAVVTRSGILKHTFPVAYVPFETTVNQDIKILVVNKDVLPRYAFHVIQGRGKDILVKTKKQGGTVDSLDFQKVLAYKVPVPPKDIQGKLVEALDNFETICSDLSIGLPAEIEARQKQYEYYRDVLLTFAETGKTILTDRQTDRQSIIKLLQYVFGYAVVKFGDIASITRGASPRPIKRYITSSEQGINWIKIGDAGINTKYITQTAERITIEGAEKSRKVKKGDFILSNSMSFGRPYILQIDGCIHDGWLSISDFEDYFVPDYLYHLLSSNGLQKEMEKKASFGGAIQNLNAEIVRTLELQIPSIDEQRRVIDLLDKFDVICNDLQSGLPAEIEKRQKQYEYYRDILLSFKK